jgi:transcriptional regulator with XRE-family HTH domain
MNRLAELLKRKKISQAHVSRMLNKSPNTVNNWCKNTTQFTIIEAQQLALIIGCKISDLIDNKSRNKE